MKVTNLIENNKAVDDDGQIYALPKCQWSMILVTQQLNGQKSRLDFQLVADDTDELVMRINVDGKIHDIDSMCTDAILTQIKILTI
jgi:hypothetical protein